MLKIPRVESFLGFDLKKSILTIQFAIILSTFIVQIKYWTSDLLSVKSLAILFAFDLLPVLAHTSCIYGIHKNKPKLMLPGLFLLFFFVWFFINCILIYPMVVENYIATHEDRKEIEAHQNKIFLIWIFFLPITVADIYYLIALYSLYMLMTEGGLDVAQDRTNGAFAVNMGAQTNDV
ncbi:uncharacterized protein LOC129577202 [Sitodiplosis mosellana]|uniref:uncharacterized protein LOC129577202 n=1 Tax=Sitodiplosis mosellana TaxID=263140 RepID=UPI0024446499|nr:uncharacterized protein LOC129577202 [Sitodiplosis mosellana]